jgi:trafficking protein particle complex subunit 8
MRNPLDAEVNLSNLTVTVREKSSTDAKSPVAYVDVEIIDDIILGANESRTVRLP